MKLRNEIKIISIDLDGTLFTSTGTIEPATIDSLQACKRHGIQLVFNTARPLKMIPPDIYLMFKEDFWIFSNGTTCKKNGEELFHFTMESDHINNLLNVLYHNHSKYFFSIEADNKIFTTSTCSLTNTRYFAEQQSLNFILLQKINKVIIIAENRDFPSDLLTYSIHPNLKVLITEKGKYVQVMPKEVSKLSAITKILELLNMNLSNLLAFGDDINDFEIILSSKIGVAMDNAVSEIKEIADHVTTSNNENGVGLFIDNFFAFNENKN